jgi:hypothetical protein
MAGGRSCGLGLTAHATAEWIANQLTEACGGKQIPRYLIRDRDRAYGEIFVRRVRSIRANGSDLNPVAVLIGKALVEIPPKFSGQPR